MGLRTEISRLYMPFIISGISLFTICLGIAIYVHPGFNMFSPSQSLSDMGALGDPNNFFFNFGVIAGGVIFFIGALSNVVWTDRWDLKRISALIFPFALVLFILIGIFPLGTPYHSIFAKGFFLLSSVAMLLWAIASYREGSKFLAFLVAGLVFLGYFLYFTYQIFGFAFAELVGGYSVIFWLLIFRK